MKKPPKLTARTTPDGQTFWSVPRADGPKTAEYPVPGDVGVLLGELGYRARVVVERLDGGAIAGKETLDAIMLDVSELGLHSTDVRDRAATRHLAKARERLAAKATAPKKRTG